MIKFNQNLTLKDGIEKKVKDKKKAKQITNKKSHGLIKKNLIAVSLSEAHAPGSIFFFYCL
jgi:hypothetical protein